MSIQRKDTPAGRRWDVVLKDPTTGRQRRKRFTRESDAKRWAAEVEADRARGTYVDDRNPTTVAQYARRWVEARPQRDSTRTRELSLITNHVEGTPLGGRRLVDVRETDVQGWATSRAQVLAPSTARYAVRIVRAVLSGAAHDGLIAKSPATRVRLPKPPKTRVVPLSVEQVRTLAEAMHHRERAMVLAQAGLGLRIAELLALRVGEVDFLRRTVHVEAQLRRGERVPLKTDAVRDLPLPDMVAEALAAHLAMHPAGPEEYLFRSRVGKPYGQQSYGETFVRAVRRASLPAGTTSHDLRHHYASLLIFHGASPHEVAERLGHTSPVLVLTTYGHLWPDSEHRTRAAVDAAWLDSAATQQKTAIHGESAQAASRL